MKKLIFSIFLVGVLVSCKDTEVEEYLTQISELEANIDSSSALLEATQIDSTGRIIRTVRDKILIVKNNYAGGDTINLEVGNLVDGYKSIRKTLARNSKIPPKLKAAIPQIKEDLANLKHDISKGVNDRSEYALYIQNETNKVKQINVLLNEFVTTQQRTLHKFDSLHPIMVDFTDKLLK
ncbi:MAG: hypothetical protein ACPGU5_06005 [Lishizhenia sp.]